MTDTTKTTQPIHQTVADKMGPQGNSLSAFIVKPKNIRFQTQEDNERIIFFLRQHFAVNIPWILIVIVLLLIPIFGGAFAFEQVAAMVPDMPDAYFLVLPIIWYIGVFGYALMSFLHWYFNIYILTNERIVDIDWVNILYKKFSTTKLDKIQDVSFKQAGFTDLIFNYGNVYVQTAGSEQNFEFISVPQADVVVHQINEMIKTL